MKTLVTGGAGFIGSHIVDALLARGNEVRVLDNFFTGRRENLAHVAGRIELIEGDVRDVDAVRRAVDGAEVVFHLASIVSVPRSMEHPRETHDVTGGGTLNVLEAARDAGVRRVVNSSSCAVYGDYKPNLPKLEDMPPAPMTPYAVCKLSGEGYCVVFNEHFGLETVSLRYFNVFGPRQDPSSPYSGVISIFANLMSQGKRPKIFGDGLQTRDFIYVADVVRANLAAAESAGAAGGVFNVGRGSEITIKRLVEMFNEVLGTDIEPIYAEVRPGDIVRSYSDSSRAWEGLGWKAEVDPVWGLGETVRSIS